MMQEARNRVVGRLLAGSRANGAAGACPSDLSWLRQDVTAFMIPASTGTDHHAGRVGTATARASLHSTREQSPQQLGSVQALLSCTRSLTSSGSAHRGSQPRSEHSGEHLGVASWQAAGSVADSTQRTSSMQAGNTEPSTAEASNATMMTSEFVFTAPAAPPTRPSTQSEEMLSLLMHPLLSRSVRNKSLNDHLVLAGEAAFLDPALTLRSMMRALHVVKQVLRANGHIYVVGGNPLTAPLLREAAHSCTNSHVWFYRGSWHSSALTLPASGFRCLFKKSHQPNRDKFAARGLRMGNVHAPPGSGDAVSGRIPGLSPNDKWLMWDRGRGGMLSESVRLLRQVVEQESAVARLPLPGSPYGGPGGGVRLLLAMSPSYDSLAVFEAHARGIPTICLINAHSRLDRITFPVYASESHIRFQHFFLDWFLKVVNLPPVTPSRTRPAGSWRPA